MNKAKEILEALDGCMAINWNNENIYTDAIEKVLVATQNDSYTLIPRMNIHGIRPAVEIITYTNKSYYISQGDVVKVFSADGSSIIGAFYRYDVGSYGPDDEIVLSTGSIRSCDIDSLEISKIKSNPNNSVWLPDIKFMTSSNMEKILDMNDGVKICCIWISLIIIARDFDNRRKLSINDEYPYSLDDLQVILDIPAEDSEVLDVAFDEFIKLGIISKESGAYQLAEW